MNKYNSINLTATNSKKSMRIIHKRCVSRILEPKEACVLYKTNYDIFT